MIKTIPGEFRKISKIDINNKRNNKSESKKNSMEYGLLWKSWKGCESWKTTPVSTNEEWTDLGSLWTWKVLLCLKDPWKPKILL